MTDLPECPRCHLAEAWRGDASGRCVKCDWHEGETPETAALMLASLARITLSNEAFDKVVELTENPPKPSENLKSLFRLDMTNVTKSCMVCGSVFVTSYTQIPVCAKCGVNGLEGADELAEVLKERISKPVSDLRREISAAINRTCRENGSNTPDYILAEFLVSCLTAFDTATRARAQHAAIPVVTKDITDD